MQGMASTLTWIRQKEPTESGPVLEHAAEKMVPFGQRARVRQTDSVNLACLMIQHSVQLK